MPITPKHVFKEKSTKLLILLPLRTIYNRTFQCETPCSKQHVGHTPTSHVSLKETNKKCHLNWSNLNFGDLVFYFLPWNRFPFLSVSKLTPFDFLSVSLFKIAWWKFRPSANISTNDNLVWECWLPGCIAIGWISVMCHASVGKHSKETINISEQIIQRTPKFKLLKSVVVIWR